MSNLFAGTQIARSQQASDPVPPLSDGYALSLGNGPPSDVESVGGSLGWEFDGVPSRIQVHGGYRTGADVDVKCSGTFCVPGLFCAQAISDLSDAFSIDRFQLLLNSSFEWRNSSDLTPYASGILDWGYHKLEAAGDSDWNSRAALAGRAGLKWDVARRWTLGIAHSDLRPRDLEAKLSGSLSYETAMAVVKTDGAENHELTMAFSLNF